MAALLLLWSLCLRFWSLWRAGLGQAHLTSLNSYHRSGKRTITIFQMKNQSFEK